MVPYSWEIVTKPALHTWMSCVLAQLHLLCYTMAQYLGMALREVEMHRLCAARHQETHSIYRMLCSCLYIRVPGNFQHKDITVLPLQRALYPPGLKRHHIITLGIQFPWEWRQRLPLRSWVELYSSTAPHPAGLLWKTTFWIMQRLVTDNTCSPPSHSHQTQRVPGKRMGSWGLPSACPAPASGPLFQKGCLRIN